MGRIRLYLSRQPIVVVERGTSMKNFSERPLGVFNFLYKSHVGSAPTSLLILLESRPLIAKGVETQLDGQLQLRGRTNSSSRSTPLTRIES